MPILKVNGVVACLVYEFDPPESFLEDFREEKAQYWHEVRGPIDAYVGDQLFKRIANARSNRRRKMAAGADAARNAAQALIDGPVNYGLAVIAYNERIELRGGGSQRVVDTQSFESAMKKLMQFRDYPSHKTVQKRCHAARFWVDKCSFELSEQYFKGFFRDGAET